MPQRLEQVVKDQRAKAEEQGLPGPTFNLYFLDESRFGLMLRLRRVLTLRGVKPLIPYQHCFANFYLFGAFSPLSGEHLLLELPQCTSDCFQLFLDHFSRQNPHQHKIIILDNGAFHHARCLTIPQNITLLFLPPYSPELNGAEKVWRHLKDALGNRLFHTLEQLSECLTEIIKQTLNTQTILSLTALAYCTQTAMTVFER